MSREEQVFAPSGFVLFGWWRSRGLNAQVAESMVHLVEAGDPKDKRLVCGRPSPKSGARVERITGLSEADAIERGVCVRCFEQALATLHVPTFSTRRTGVGNRYGRGASGSGGRNTHVTCSCGWQNRSNVTKREQVANHRDHVRDVLAQGLFRIEADRYEPEVGGVWRVASACGCSITTGVGRHLDELRVGAPPLDLPHAKFSERRVRVTRTEEAYLPEELMR